MSHIYYIIYIRKNICYILYYSIQYTDELCKTRVYTSSGTSSLCPPPGRACGLKELHEVKHGDLSNMLEGGGSVVGFHIFMTFLIVYVGQS